MFQISRGGVFIKRPKIHSRLQNPRVLKTFRLCVVGSAASGFITSIYARFPVPLHRIISFISLSAISILSFLFLIGLLHRRIHEEKPTARTMGLVFLIAACEVALSFLLAFLITNILTFRQISIYSTSTLGFETALGLTKSLLIYPVFFCAVFAVLIEKSIRKAYWKTLLRLISQRYFSLFAVASICVGLSALSGIYIRPPYDKMIAAFFTSVVLFFSIELCMPPTGEATALS